MPATRVGETLGVNTNNRRPQNKRINSFNRKIEYCLIKLNHNISWSVHQVQYLTDGAEMCACYVKYD